jgi:hypothetical protein
MEITKQHIQKQSSRNRHDKERSKNDMYSGE